MFCLRRPHHTEKSLALNEKDKYTFIVELSATKNEIKKTVERFYKVEVLGVNTAPLPKKTVQRYRARRMVKGVKSRYKKAVVQIKKGQMIDLYETN